MEEKDASGGGQLLRAPCGRQLRSPPPPTFLPRPHFPMPTHEFPQPLTTVSEPCSCPALTLETDRRPQLWERPPHTVAGKGPEATAPLRMARGQRNMAALLTTGGGRREAALDWRNRCHVGSLVTRETSPLGTPLTTPQVNNHPGVSL